MPQLPLAVSLGDPAGIGPEIILNAYMQLKEAGEPFFVVGGYDVLRACSEAWGDPAKTREPIAGDGAVEHGQSRGRSKCSAMGCHE